MVESAVLTDDLHHVKSQALLNSGMEKLLREDSAFWVVKPLLVVKALPGWNAASGAYIDFSRVPKVRKRAISLLDSPPLAPLDC